MKYFNRVTKALRILKSTKKGHDKLAFTRLNFGKCCFSSSNADQSNHDINGKYHLNLSAEVKQALHEQKPVVALESTIITHGMPSPYNISTAKDVEEIIRSQGAVPATIAILQGKVTVGLSNEELEFLASAQNVVKTSRRDFPYVLSQHLTGGTTVSGTMIVAKQAGISVFVTGGIGGVHRGAESSMDISADLTELGKTPVAVVSAGIKSILDIGRTLEYLETQGVCVATFGDNHAFPAFFSRNSGHKSPYSVSNPFDAAKLINSNLKMKLNSGMLIGVPIPEEHAASGGQIDAAIQQAVKESSELKILGKEVTPFILKRVNEITGGESLEANIALIKNNAMVGSQIACALAGIQREETKKIDNVPHSHVVRPKTIDPTSERPVVIGGTNVDITAAFNDQSVIPNGATYRGAVRQSFGGVGRNIADCLTRMKVNPLLLSAVGTDNNAELLDQQLNHMDFDYLKRDANLSTATYCAIMNHSGELIYGMGDFEVHSKITVDYVSKYEENLISAPLVCIDGNIPAETIEYVCEVCHSHQIPVWFEPTDLSLVEKVFTDKAWQTLSYVSPNMNELRKLHSQIKGQTINISKASSQDGSLEDTLEEALSLAKPVIDIIPNLLITLGRHGVMFCRSSSPNQPLIRKGLMNQKNDFMNAYYYPAYPVNHSQILIKSVSGAGDCLASAVIAGAIGGHPQDQSVTSGLKAALKSVQSFEAIPATINEHWLDTNENSELWDKKELII